MYSPTIYLVRKIARTGASKQQISLLNFLIKLSIFENITTIADKVMSMFLNKEYDSVQIVYNNFKNSATQIVTQFQYVPI